ncbi:MAG: hypothetical protein JXA57_07465, partial [Armatimonadetes bacterium]|nr:hypothetical protein [Armatimonadota bacterium]
MNLRKDSTPPGVSRSTRAHPWLLVFSLVLGGTAGLSAQVEEVWSAQYDNPDLGSDVAGDIA